MMAKAVETVVMKYPYVKLLLGGWLDMPFFSNLPEDKIIYKAWTGDMGQYFKNLSNIDIGITPLLSGMFNQCKSNLKYIEMAGIGIPVIASSVYPYSHTITTGVDGILIKNNDSIIKRWTDELSNLVEHPEVRRKLGENGRKLVAEKYTVQKIAKQWADFYKEVTK
jgi:glycosyltransferase involved in cell wall biosynthesis